MACKASLRGIAVSVVLPHKMIDITDARAVRPYIPRNNQLVYSPTCQLLTEKWVDARAVRPYIPTAFPMQKQMECAGNVGTHGPCVRPNRHAPTFTFQSRFKAVIYSFLQMGFLSHSFYRAIWVILSCNMGHFAG